MKAPKSELVSRAGVHYAGYVFSTEGIVFRETASTDVGIDGQLELISSDGVATGMLIGVQVKSGDSFVDSNSKVFSFKASKEHFGYWKRLCMPVIGVVYSPALKIASWFDLTKHSEGILKNNKPLVIKQVLNEQNAFEIGHRISHLKEWALEYYKQPVSKDDVEKLHIIQKEVTSDSLSSKEESWKRLISIFFSSDSDSEVIGEVGYQLSWYFPTVSEIQKNQFKDRLQILTLFELNRIFDSVKLAMERNRDDVVSHTLDLISYKPDITKLLDKLDDEGLINHQDKWILEQMKEYIDNCI
jgi:hypothetical protein